MLGQEGRHVSIGVVGLGGRGQGQLKVLLDMPDVDVRAVCDVYEDRTQEGVRLVQEKKGYLPFATQDYRELVARPDIEAVVVMTNWTTHIRIAVAAMRAGKYAAMEVGGASSIGECWDLVRTSEETGMPCMMIENCCYNREEMALLNMVKKGLFGQLVHCQGGYEHGLQSEIGNGDTNRHYRQENFLHRNGELYPTHELGPISKYLDINRGNRLTMLTSMASLSLGMHSWFQENRPDHPLAHADFREGDIVTTMIKCARGETIFLIHDCSLPRPYSRGGRVQGTRGIWMEDNRSIFLKGLSPEEPESWDPHHWESFDKYLEEYDHPLWKEYKEFGLRGGHGGMDYLVLRGFIEAVQKHEPTPIDVYDTATWMSITCLSEDSIAMGSMPVAIPDFTSGRWIGREPATPGCFALDAVYEEYFQ